MTSERSAAISRAFRRRRPARGVRQRPARPRPGAEGRAGAQSGDDRVLQAGGGHEGALRRDSIGQNVGVDDDERRGAADPRPDA